MALVEDSSTHRPRKLLLPLAILWVALALSLLGLPAITTADSRAPIASSSEASSSAVVSPAVDNAAAAAVAGNGGKQINANDQLLPDYSVQVVPVNTSLSTTQAAAAVVQTMLTERVVAAVGPMTSSQAHVLSAIHTQVQLPTVSYSATDPSLSAASYPFFARTIRSDALEMQAIADLVAHFSWLEVITIYSDDDYGRNGVNQLTVLLDKLSIDVVKSIPVQLDASLSDIIVRLLAAQKLESTVFILQLNLELIVPVLTAALEVGMMTPGYVWIATEGVVSELENLPELSTEGVIGTRVFVPPNAQLPPSTLSSPMTLSPSSPAASTPSSIPTPPPPPTPPLPLLLFLLATPVQVPWVSLG
ncbi:hypothetical protein CLOP_g24266 [Closterium sp. NIES-67]|nr:hypothetical protein CLOP_g24266 [Closterium sp. NIES-67]